MQTGSVALMPASLLGRWVPARMRTALVLLIGGLATLATSFAALPAPVLGVICAVWCVAVVWFAHPSSGTVGFTVLSICVKATTLAFVGVLILDPGASIGPQNGLYWIPLGVANMGSGLWFLALIRGRAR